MIAMAGLYLIQMNRIMRGLALSIFAVVCAASCDARMPSAEAPQPAVEAAHFPVQLHGAKAAVLFFIGLECPVSNGYAPEMNRLCEKYTARNVKFLIVCADSDASPAAIAEHARAYGFACDVIPDPRHELSRALGATTTPESVLIGPGDKVCYRGRIDDLYIALGQRRYEARAHDLQDALDAVLAGRPVAKAWAPPIGCAIGA